MDTSMDSLSDAESNSSWILLNENETNNEELKEECDDNSDNKQINSVVSEEPNEAHDKNSGTAGTGHESDTSDGISIISEIDSDHERNVQNDEVLSEEEHKEETNDNEDNKSLIETVPSYIIETKKVNNIKIPSYFIVSVFGALIAVSSFYIFQFINSPEIQNVDSNEFVYISQDILLPKETTDELTIRNSFDIAQYCAVRHQNDDLYKEYNEQKCIKAFNKQLKTKPDEPIQIAYKKSVGEFEIIGKDINNNFYKKDKNGKNNKEIYGNTPEEKLKFKKKKKEFLNAQFVQAKENFLVAKENFLKNKERYLRNVADTIKDKRTEKRNKEAQNNKTKGEKYKQKPERENKNQKRSKERCSEEYKYKEKSDKNQKHDRDWKENENNDKFKIKKKEYKDKSKNYEIKFKENYDYKKYNNEESINKFSNRDQTDTNLSDKNNNDKVEENKIIFFNKNNDMNQNEEKKENYNKLYKNYKTSSVDQKYNKNYDNSNRQQNNIAKNPIVYKDYLKVYNKNNMQDNENFNKNNYKKREQTDSKTYGRDHLYKKDDDKKSELPGKFEQHKSHGRRIASKYEKHYEKDHSYKYKHFQTKEYKGKRNNSISGDWYHNMYDDRNQIRKKERQSEWIFDRADMRNKKRDKAQWYFQWMSDREQFRYKRGYRFATD